MMNKKAIGIVVFGLLFLATACVQKDIDSPLQGASTATSEPGSNEIQLQYEGIGPLEITPGPDLEESATGSDDQVTGIISSSGEESSGSGSKRAEPGFVDSVAPSSSGLDLEKSLEVEWLTYQDKTYSFSIDYPSIYVVLPETEDLSKVDPAKVHQVRFQDIQLATGETAEFELPMFLIEVFEPGKQSLETFISRNEPGGAREAYQVNNLNGIRVYYNQLIAPNEFYFFSSQDYVYKLTPLGPFGPDMLESFNIQ
jgi:hypothetical protein